MLSSFRASHLKGGLNASEARGVSNFREKRKGTISLEIWAYRRVIEGKCTCIVVVGS